MAPPIRFTEEQLLAAALDLIRTQGEQGLTARALAQKMGCSVQPIFSLYPNMEAVRNAALGAAYAVYQRYMQADMQSGKYPPYKGSGMGYIRFAKEEPMLFRFLMMRDRSQEGTQGDEAAIAPILALIQEKYGLSKEEAHRFHLEMWLYVHGIASMIATGYIDWDLDFADRALTDAYRGFIAQFQSPKP